MELEPTGAGGRAIVQVVQDLPSPGSEEVELEEIHAMPDHPGKITRVAADLPQKLKQKSTSYLDEKESLRSVTPRSQRNIS